MNVDVEYLNALVGEGWLKRREYDDFVVWDYTQKTQAARHWTPETAPTTKAVSSRQARYMWEKARGRSGEKMAAR